MNILLVCKYNRFRSKFAEVFFNKYTNHNVKSAGIIGGLPIDDEIFQCAGKYGLELDETVRTLDWSMLNWQQMIIIVANNVPKELFEDVTQAKDVSVWKVPDTHPGDAKGRIRIIEMIKEKVKEF